MMNKLWILITLMALMACPSAQTVQVPIHGDPSIEDLSKAVRDNSIDGRTTIVIVFDDGQMLSVTGSKADAESFLAGRIDKDEYLAKLEITPLTRGPLVTPSMCDQNRSMYCNNTVTCACYDSQECRPGDPRADKKGCVDPVPPANAHLEGAEYVCDEGLVWGKNLTGCQEKTVCPDEIIGPDGKCFTPKKEEPTTCCIPGLPALITLGAALLSKTALK
jgi:hypothetical protein